MAGVNAAVALNNNSVTDFLLVEYQDHVGGRMHSVPFGMNNETGEPYTVEAGANWVQGLGSEGGPENPIWTLVCGVWRVNRGFGTSANHEDE